MTRTSITSPLAAALAVVLALPSVANAGGCHGGGARFQSFPVAGYSATPARPHRASVAKAKPSKPARVQTATAAKPTAKPATEAAQQEPSRPTAGETADAARASSSAAEGTVTVASAEPTCTRFFPALGTTVEVACTQE